MRGLIHLNDRETQNVSRHINSKFTQAGTRYCVESILTQLCELINLITPSEIALREDNSSRQPKNRYSPALALGTNLAAGMIVCTYLGITIDKKIHSDDQYFTLAGMFLGLFYAAYEVWKIIRETPAGDERNNDDP